MGLVLSGWGRYSATSGRKRACHVGVGDLQLSENNMLRSTQSRRCGNHGWLREDDVDCGMRRVDAALTPLDTLPAVRAGLWFYVGFGFPAKKPVRCLVNVRFLEQLFDLLRHRRVLHRGDHQGEHGRKAGCIDLSGFCSAVIRAEELWLSRASTSTPLKAARSLASMAVWISSRQPPGSGEPGQGKYEQTTEGRKAEATGNH